jgi:hypothetical protein
MPHPCGENNASITAFPLYLDIGKFKSFYKMISCVGHEIRLWTSCFGIYRADGLKILSFAYYDMQKVARWQKRLRILCMRQYIRFLPKGYTFVRAGNIIRSLCVLKSRKYKKITTLVVVMLGVTFLLGGTYYAQRLNAETNLLGSWCLDSSSTFSFLGINPREREILRFKSDGVVDFQIESIKFAREEYKFIDLTFTRIQIRGKEYGFSISGDKLIITSGSDQAIYRRVEGANLMAL